MRLRWSLRAAKSFFRRKSRFSSPPPQKGPFTGPFLLVKKGESNGAEVNEAPVEPQSREELFPQKKSILLTSTKDSLDEPKLYMINGLFVLEISFADLA